MFIHAEAICPDTDSMHGIVFGGTFVSHVIN